MMANNHIHRPFEVNEGARGKEKVVGGTGVALPGFHGEPPGVHLLIVLLFQFRKCSF